MNIRWEDMGSDYMVVTTCFEVLGSRQGVAEIYVDIRLVRPTLAYTY